MVKDSIVFGMRPCCPQAWSLTLFHVMPPLLIVPPFTFVSFDSSFTFLAWSTTYSPHLWKRMIEVEHRLLRTFGLFDTPIFGSRVCLHYFYCDICCSPPLSDRTLVSVSLWALNHLDWWTLKVSPWFKMLFFSLPSSLLPPIFLGSSFSNFMMITMEMNEKNYLLWATIIQVWFIS